jgi:hypothetical protein
MIGARVPASALGRYAFVGAIAVLAAVSRPTAASADDRTAAEAILKTLATQPQAPGATATAPSVNAEALARTREAIEQATRLRAAGDEAHAKAADGLAREWAETARDLALAADAEKLAADRKRQSMLAQAQLQRTRALVEEGLARLGRLRAELEAAPPPKVAVETHDGQPKATGGAQAATGAGTSTGKAQTAPGGSTP